MATPAVPIKLDEGSAAEPIGHRYELSLMLGGPLHQLYRRTQLARDGLGLLHRRVIVIPLIAWLPAFVLSLVDGYAWSGVKVPFLLDVETHARLLVALPLLIIAELVVHNRMPTVVRQFVEHGIIDEEVRPKFSAAIDSALRLRNSVLVELLLLAFVYAIGIAVIWRESIALPVATWYRLHAGASDQLTLAGWGYLIVSLPIFQFLLFRWYFRLFVWTRFLWQVSRMDLKLEPLNPDRAAGLGFLSGLPRAFAPLLLAHGALLAGTFADGIFFNGMTLPQYKVEFFSVTAIAVFLVVGPLLVFVPVLTRTRRAGVREYGAFAQHYARDFRRKWLHEKLPTAEPLLGTSDIQSLADLGNSFAVVENMRHVPVTRSTVAYLAVVTAIPVAPLLLTMISLDELVDRFAKLLF